MKATVLGTASTDRLIGTSGDDVIRGRGGKDVLVGKGGDDLLCGGGANDVLRAGEGADRLDGGRGEDRISGGSERDRIHGRAGDDEVNGDDGGDVISGEGGNDALNGGEGVDICRGGSGTNSETGCERGARNRAPTAVADAATTLETEPVSISLLANDSDPDGDSLTATADTSASRGMATIASGDLVYNPGNAFDGLAPGETATDRVTYTVSDGFGGTASAEAAVTIQGVDTPPTAVADTITQPYIGPGGLSVADFIEDEQYRLAGKIIANDTDVDGGPLFWTGPTTFPANGVIFILTDLRRAESAREGVYVNNQNVCPAPGGIATDSFESAINGGSTATVTMNIVCP